MDLGISGLASGFDWRSLVDQLAAVERAPQTRLRSEQSTLQLRNNALTSIKTQMEVLRNRVTTLMDPDLYDARSATVDDTTIATATAGAGTPLGRYTFNFTQLATAAAQRGTADVGHQLSDTDDVSSLVLSEAGFPTSITAGTFTVNGETITIATSDTLQSVFDQINTATGGHVTGSYSAAADTITLTSDNGAIVLGSATDTSNFLEVTKLYNNGTSTIQSAAQLGGVRLSSTLAAANLSQTITDGGGGAGVFKINGVEISFDASTDTVADVLARISDSGAGVYASYDPSTDQFSLTNKATGDMGIVLEDVTGNFLAATGLSGGSLQRGTNLLYTINGGGQLISFSNTVTESSSGIAGLSVTAHQQDSTTIEVTSDSDTIKTAINDFLTEYNKVQTMIDTETSSTTDADGKVTAGVLANDSDASDIATQLRRIVNAEVTGLSGTLQRLEQLGIVSNGNDNTLSLSESTTLDNALATNLSSVKELFTDETNGLAVQLDAYLENTVGEEGTLVTHQDTLTNQVADIDTQIADLERQVQANRERMIASFVAMEKAQAQINQQLQYLTQQFYGS